MARSAEPPIIALLACVDARIDTCELRGERRRYNYVVRTAGSILAEPEQQMLELAVKNGVRVVALTTHGDRAAEKVARDPALRARFPVIAAEVDARAQRIAQFEACPAIRQALAAGQLEIYRAHIETGTERLLVRR